MDAGGSWVSLLRRVKSFSELEKVWISGALATLAGLDTDAEHWSIWERTIAPALRWYTFTDPCPKELEDYLVRDGPCPLRDDNMVHEQLV